VRALRAVQLSNVVGRQALCLRPAARSAATKQVRAGPAARWARIVDAGACQNGNLACHASRPRVIGQWPGHIVRMWLHAATCALLHATV
jgi:hypothetical protein